MRIAQCVGRNRAPLAVDADFVLVGSVTPITVGKHHPVRDVATPGARDAVLMLEPFVEIGVGVRRRRGMRPDRGRNDAEDDEGRRPHSRPVNARITTTISSRPPTPPKP